MQHSRSLGSFTALITPEESLVARPRARSSLDTFVIPGRTRIPSHKPHPIDFEIAQNLLNFTMTRTIRPTPDGEQNLKFESPSDRLQKPPTSPETSQEITLEPDVAPQRNPHEVKATPRQRKQTLYPLKREIMIIPQRHQRRRSLVAKVEHENEPPQKAEQADGYDGAFGSGSGYDSRVTSMSWSTISQRVMSSSSGSSPSGPGPLEALEHYNRLASRQGLLEMERCPGDENYEKKMTRKVHHHGWLARKLFRRSSSTFALEVKATAKPMTRKISLNKMPKISDGERRNILKDKSLEEMSRLGGLGILTLPPAYAVDKLTLPTCLAAIGNYLLQHGTNQPGLFRVSGQSQTVSQLYEYYAYQFFQAGSPSKVNETVGSAALPAHIDIAVPDVASFFKKILNSLPGGLLGSVDLFNMLHGIFFNFVPNPEQSDATIDNLRAKMIALAILSVPSQYRIYLIQAVLGLGAYFGCEAEKALGELTASGSAANGRSAELMGFRSLGVVLGPLLLGDLTEEINIENLESEGAHRKSTESSRKIVKREKRNSLTSKLDRSTGLAAQIEKANLAANVMELLLMSWKKVVVQLRRFNGNISAASQPKQSKHAAKSLKAAQSRLTLRNSEEDALFMNVLRGRILPDEEHGEVKVKKTVRVSSRSPVLRPLLKESKRSTSETTFSKDVNKAIEASEGMRLVPDLDRKARRTRSSHEAFPDSTRDKGVLNPQAHGSHIDDHSDSDETVDHMTMGTILPPLDDKAMNVLSQTLQQPAPRTPSPPTLVGSSSARSADRRQRGLVRTRSDPEQLDVGISSRHNKPLPSIGDAQKAELSSPLLADSESSMVLEDHFPTRQSSLPNHKRLPPQFPETRSKSRQQRSRQQNSSSFDLSNRKAHEAGHVLTGSSSSTDDSKTSSVKAMAQRFTEVSRATRRAQKKDEDVVQIYAQINELETPTTPDRSTRLSLSPRTSPGRTSLIPKPVKGVGSARKRTNRTPSPSKSSTPKPREKPTSATSVPSEASTQSISPHNSTARDGLPQANARQGRSSRSALEERSDSSLNCERTNSGNFLEVAPTRPLSAYSSESIRRSRLEEEPPVAQHLTPASSRIISFDVDTTKSAVRTSFHDTAAPNMDLAPLQRTGSMNATLLAEISRLKRVVEQKNKEIDSTKRTLDAVKDAREVNLPALSAGGVNRGELFPGANGASVKGTLSEEVRVVRRERNEWRKRAEWAESRLAALDERRKASQNSEPQL